MKNTFFGACVLLCAPVLALAQVAATAQPAGQANPADPLLAVPPVIYQSVFAESPKGVELNSVDWKKANADVGQFTRGHIDILKWEASQTPPPVAPKPAQPGTHKH